VKLAQIQIGDRAVEEGDFVDAAFPIGVVVAATANEAGFDRCTRICGNPCINFWGFVSVQVDSYASWFANHDHTITLPAIDVRHADDLISETLL
jgi:hypothetical protein